MPFGSLKAPAFFGGDGDKTTSQPESCFWKMIGILTREVKKGFFQKAKLRDKPNSPSSQKNWSSGNTTSKKNPKQPSKIQIRFLLKKNRTTYLISKKNSMSKFQDDMYFKL